MPAAFQPAPGNEIPDAALAALDEQDIPSIDEELHGPYPDCEPPDEYPDCEPSGELAGAAMAELSELADTAVAELEELADSAPGGRPAIGAAWFLLRDGSGGESGFADGGQLDTLAAGVALADFADDAHARLAAVTDDELIGVLRGWRRLASWAQARELAAVAELARRRPADGTPPALPGEFPARMSEFIGDEVALALTLTGCAAARQLDLALGLAERPATAATLEAGLIDLPRARIIVEGVIGLTATHAAAVEAAVLADAPGMTTGQLRSAVARAVLAADPDAARQQREEELQDARVECWANPAGTANLAGRNLPSAQALAADKRLGEIAAAWKRQIAAAWKHADPDEEPPSPAAGTDLLRAAPT